MTSSTLAPYAQALQERSAANTLRSLRRALPGNGARISIDGKDLLNFASNDYLGLSRHPLLIERSIRFTERFGAGNGASRLLSGNLAVFEQIEEKLAALKGSQSALILPSGFQANSSIISCLLKKNSFAAADKLVHRSMLEGLKASEGKWIRFRHNDFEILKEQLKQRQLKADSPRWLFCESLYSMDGDLVALEPMLECAAEFGFAVYIDEAHAGGLMGKNGMGLLSGKQEIQISMGTFGKAMGSFGAYVCLPSVLRNYLINFCPGLIYSTAAPPPVLGAIDAALDLIPSMQNEAAALLSRAARLRAQLQDLGFDTGNSNSHIIPLILGSAASALSLSAYLEEAGFYLPAIRPPTVAENQSRLRLSLCANHQEEEIETLVSTLGRWNEKKT